MKKLILIFILTYSASLIANASNRTCKIEQVNNEELATLAGSKQVKDAIEYSKCGDVFFSQVNESESNLCFFDEFTIDDRGSTKLGRYWGGTTACQSYSSSQFLFFEDYDDSNNIRQVKRIYEFWQTLTEQKTELLRSKVGWFKRNFDNRFSAFFDMLDSSSREVQVSNSLRYDLEDGNLISFTINEGKRIWLVDVYFAQDDIEIKGIYRVVI